ncbi:RodZ domain-containing protein [Rhodanobacter sp. AS-Z3]|uniref:helix-turn-helix domain-containing protein n=1 Tax=Rhodanobacter sp. AS-Z3 TaxID=3031330 RepID=UPI0031F2F078
MPSQSAGQTSDKSDLFGINLLNMDVSVTDPHAASFGSRLHAAREARGLDIEGCAHALRLAGKILRQLEHDQYEGIDSKVYLASYIAKYARHLGINEVSIQVELDRIKQVDAPLVATGGISHSRFLLDRYATAATYVVLTAVIVVPMVWLGVRGTLDRSLTHLAPLDAAPVAQIEAPALQSANSNQPTADAVATAPLTTPTLTMQSENQPLLASMAPFPSLENSSLSPVQPAALPVETGVGSHSLSLSLSSASWVEVIQTDGTRLEYGLLAAGTSKTYHSNQALDVRIGNASGAQVVIDGASVGLDDFRRANVAHFRMQMQGGKASAATL